MLLVLLFCVGVIVFLCGYLLFCVGVQCLCGYLLLCLTAGILHLNSNFNFTESRVSSDLHEWRNEGHTVSTRDSVKLKLLLRCRSNTKDDCSRLGRE